MELETSNPKPVETSENHVMCEEVSIVFDRTSESPAISDEIMESEKRGKKQKCKSNLKFLG